MCDSITNGGNINSGFVQPLSNLVVSNSVTTTNVVAAGNVSAAQFIGAGGFAVVTGGPTVGVTGNIYASNALTATNVYANLVQFSNTINYYQASNPVPFNGGPYTTALSSDGSTLVLGALDGGGAAVYNIQEDSISSLDYESPYNAWSVSINAAATVIAVGDPNNNFILVFRRKNDGTWSRTPDVIPGTSNFGFSVSINDIGDKILTCQGAGSGGWNYSVDSSAYLYTFNDPNWDLTTTFPGIAGTSVALSGDGLTCVFGQSYFGDQIGRVSITKDLGATYKYFYGDVAVDGLGYYVSSNRDGTRIVANSSYGYIKIFTLE